MLNAKLDERLKALEAKQRFAFKSGFFALHDGIVSMAVSCFGLKQRIQRYPRLTHVV
jgi:hypothetical protein